MTGILPTAAMDQHGAILGKTGRKRLPIPPRKSCVRCGAGFQPTPKYPQQRFCSRGCGLKACNPADHNAVISRKSARGRGDAQRGRGRGASYIKLNGRHAHRVIAERMLGRPLTPGEVVHHRDGDRRNNDPANLQVLPSQAEHARLHLKGKPSPRKGRKFPRAGGS